MNKEKIFKIAEVLGHVVGKFLAWFIVAIVCSYCWNTIAPKFEIPYLSLWEVYTTVIGIAFLLRFAKRSLTE